jgi:hypothetical protein
MRKRSQKGKIQHEEDPEERPGETAAPAQEGNAKEWKDNRQSHLDCKRPKSGVDLGRVVVANEQHMLQDQWPAERSGPGLTEPMRDRDRLVKIEVSEQGKPESAKIRQVDARQAAEQKCREGKRTAPLVRKTEDKPAQQKEKNDRGGPVEDWPKHLLQQGANARR